jgi:predicted transcriptional regulator
MRYVWANAEQGCLAADLQQALEAERPSALTTLLTTLDRLHSKGIVHREREGKAYRFFPAVTQEELEQRIVQGVLDNLIARFPKAVATYFSESGDDVSSLSALARLVEEGQSETGESG